ncbi:MAG: rhomboid family intramembrane serine protease [Bacteroidales bacterium]|jgi:membrane associated rhomboid family serine protease|nr:rhomboid family intramembrane serine protease [Bacteroidales bacterium]
MANVEKYKLINAALPGMFFGIIMSILMVWAYYGHIDIGFLGIHPLHTDGLPGILTAPFVHSGFDHLYSNLIPFIFLSALLFHFYRSIAWEVFSLIWIITGTLVWMGARENWHIGASGVVYGLAVFHVSSGIVRRDNRLMAISFLTIFLYGGMLWGIFPEFFPGKRISWESHLAGAITGLILAIYYRKEGPVKMIYHWDEDEDDPETDTEDAYWKDTTSTHPQQGTEIRYHTD